MNVVSLFDGKSCGQVALKRVGVKVDNYFASEIDKYSIEIAMKHFPNTKLLGDVQFVSTTKIHLPKIDLLIGGSPCQGFSFAGKQLNFKDKRSKLFFEYVRILKELKKVNPNIYFLLENVKMKQSHQDVISKYLGVKPININAALVSAQNRERLYWTNIPNITQPSDLGIYLKDIVEDKYNVLGAAIRNQVTSVGTYEQLNIRKDGKSNCVVPSYTKRMNGCCMKVGTANDIKGFDIIKRIYSKEGKAPCLTTMQGGHRHPKIAIDEYYYRRLTPLECERLQCLPDNYTEGVSNSQRYKMIGNGWCIDVIAHIFKGLK